MTVERNLATAWTLLAAPVILFIPALAVAGMGPCAFRYPIVIVAADALFAVMEGAALGLFATTHPPSIGTRVGCVLTFVMIFVTVFFELLLVTDYVWAQHRSSTRSGGERKEGRLPNRVVDIFASSVKQITSVLMIFVGSLLAANTSSGPCGGTSLAAEPIPAIFVAILGLELILCSYFPVKRLAVESSFRAIIYLFLLMWSLGSFVPAVRIAFPAMTGNVPDTNDLLFSLLRGVVAVANLVAFYRWTGIRNIITRTW